MSKSAEQVETVSVSIESIMRSADFRRGFDEVRAGRPPCFDNDACHNDWHYERGRLFACIAPISMRLKIDGKLNPKAISLYVAACRRGYVL